LAVYDSDKNEFLSGITLPLHKIKQMKKKNSIHDIAKQLNVSATTVSFVLNGRAAEKRIGKDLEKKILQYVKKVDYQPNMVARSLRTGKSKILGMMVEYISDPFFSSITQLIEEKAYQLGYKLLYSSTENDTQKSKELIRVYRERQVDGYIIAPAPGIENEVKALIRDNIPVVLFDRFFPKLSTLNVVVDNMGGCYNATKYFIQNGYRKIAMVTLDADQMQMTERLKGYTKAIEEKKRKPIITKIPFAISNEERVSLIQEFIKTNKAIDAILFATNYLAISGLKSIEMLGLKIPDDIGIISFDDNTHFDLFSPSVTAVAQPVEAIANEVIRLLGKCLSEGNYKKHGQETVVLPTKLMIRNSAVAVNNEHT
jgi:LacI family transcriptional regulator